MKNKENPFYFGSEVYDNDFCNRTEDLNELQKDINSGLNVLLYAPRRFGKTSLIKKLQTKLLKDKNYIFIYFDFFRFPVLTSLFKNILIRLLKVLKPHRRKFLICSKQLCNFVLL